MPIDDLSRDLARHVARCRYDDIPVEAAEAAKKSILDLLGVSLAASGTVPAIKGVMELVRDHGGNQQCSVLGFGERVPPIMAAFANGAMAHCLDFDDVAPDGNHASSTLIPAVFAAAEHLGGLSGKQLVAAVAVGQDVFLRMRRSLLGQRMDWLATTVFGVFSATAGVCSVLRLNEDQIANAFGIATLGSCGTLEMRFGTGSDLGELYAGFVAKNAVMSGMLARNGITGTQRAFEGRAGIMNVYFGGEYDRDVVLNGLGSDFMGASMQYKPWPVCGIANTYIHAVLKLVRQNSLKATDIEQIRPFVGDFQQRMSYPLEERRRPTCAMDARFSLPFCLATAAVYGDVRIENFTERGLEDSQVLAMAQKVVPTDDDSLDWKGEMPDARVEIVTRTGVVLSETGQGTPGSKDWPLGWDDLISKFRSCAVLAACPKSDAEIADVANRIRTLEALSDATEVVRRLS